MPTEVPVKLKLKAVDNITNVLKKATRGLDRIKKATQRASNAMKNFQARTKGIRDSLGKVGKGFKNVGKNLSTKVTLPIVGVAAAMIKTAADFEKSMNKVKALSQAGAADFKELRDKAVELGSSTKFSASEAAEAMAFLAQAGQKPKQILQGIAPLLDLAAASSTDLARTADIASNVMGAFGLEASKTKDVADVFARATAGSNVTLEMIAESMKDAAPLAKNFGASLEETTAAIGMLGNIGIQGSKAGTALKNAFLNLSAPTAGAKKALSALGIQVADEQGNMLKFGTIMQNLGSRLADLPQKGRLQALNLIFGKIGIAAATNLAKVAKTGELEKFTKKMNDTRITAKSMADTMNKGAAGAMVTLKSAMEGLAIAIAGSGPDSPIFAFTKLIQKLAKFIQWLSKIDSNILTTGLIVAGLVAAIGPLVTIFGTLIGIIPTLITIAGALKIGFIALTGAVLGIPALIAAIVAAGIMLVKHWDTVKEFSAVLWMTIKNNFVDGLSFIVKAFEFAFGGLGGFLDKTWEGFKTTMSEGLNWIINKAKGILKFLPDFVKTKIGITPEFEKSLEAPDLLKKDKIIDKGLQAPNAFANLGASLGKPAKQIQQNVIQLGEKREIKRAGDTVKNESKVMVKFENAPKGMTLKTESTDDSMFSVDTGLQASNL